MTPLTNLLSQLKECASDGDRPLVTLSSNNLKRLLTIIEIYREALEYYDKHCWLCTNEPHEGIVSAEETFLHEKGQAAYEALLKAEKVVGE